jgi:hypothetical protein
MKTPVIIADPSVFVSLSTVPSMSNVSIFDELHSTFLANLKQTVEEEFEIIVEV